MAGGRAAGGSREPGQLPQRASTAALGRRSRVPEAHRARGQAAPQAKVSALRRL